MTDSRAQDVLYASEAALRLVDQEINGLCGTHRNRSAQCLIPPADLSAILEQASSRIQDVLGHLRASRTALRETALGRLVKTHEKIVEVTTATEDAAIDILDSCERATCLLDELDLVDCVGATGSTRAADIRTALRDELFRMMSALQFQDITSQQLAHASSVMLDMEQRLAEVVCLFDQNGDRQESFGSVRAPDPNTFDSCATSANVRKRQALADELFRLGRISVS